MISGTMHANQLNLRMIFSRFFLSYSSIPTVAAGKRLITRDDIFLSISQSSMALWVLSMTSPVKIFARATSF